MRETPEGRARRLLRRHLSAEQSAQLTKDNTFVERTRTRVYSFRLYPQHQLVHVEYRPEYAPTFGGGGLCIRAFGRNLPAADHALALLLFLRVDETAFRSTANNWRVWPRGVRRDRNDAIL